MDIGKTIKLLRTAAGMDQKSLANSIDVSPSLISFIENGQREPSLSQLKKISHVLQVPVSILVFDNTAATDNVSGKLKHEIDSMHESILKIFGQYLQQPPNKLKLKDE